MIVVIGALGLRGADLAAVPAGAAAAIAIAAAEAGSAVQCIAKVGDDPAGDVLLLALARAGVGHVATLRDASHRTPVEPVAAVGSEADADVDPGDDGVDPTVEATGDLPEARRPTLEPADVGLALRYLPDHRVIVVVQPDSTALLQEATDAASWSGAHLAVVLDPATRLEPPAEAFVLAVAGDAAEGLGPLIGRYAALVDAGSTPADAFVATLGAAAER